MLSRFSKAGLLCTALLLASSCTLPVDIIDDLKAADAAIDKLQAQDKNAIEIVYSTTFTQVFDTVGKTVGAAVDTAMSKAPGYKAAASEPTEISGSVDETVAVKTGGSVTLKGTYKVTPNADETMTLDIDLTSTWTGLSVAITGATVVSSGSGTMKVSLIMRGDKGAAGTVAWKGTLNADGTDLPFDLVVTLDGDAITMAGTINGKTFSFDAAEYANKNEDEQNQDEQQDLSNTGITSISLSTGTVSPALSDSENDYSTDVSSGTTSLTVSVTAADEKAQVEMTKVSGDCTVSGSVISGMAPGLTYKVAIDVTAQDGTTKRTVNLTVNVAAVVNY